MSLEQTILEAQQATDNLYYKTKDTVSNLLSKIPIPSWFKGETRNCIFIVIAGIIIWVIVYSLIKWQKNGLYYVYDSYKDHVLSNTLTSLYDQLPEKTEGKMLRDYYIAASNKSYIPGNWYLSFCLLDSLKSVILCGARFLDLDICLDSFYSDAEPLVGLVSEEAEWKSGNWRFMYNDLKLDACLDMISKTAFSLVSNRSDPLFLFFNIHFDPYNHKGTCEIIIQLLMKHFSTRLLDTKQTTNITARSIKEFFGKVVVTCNKNCKGTALEEIINITWDTNANYTRQQTFEDITEDKQYSNTAYNRAGMTMIKLPNRMNPDFVDPFSVGTQIVCMNYGLPNNNMDTYLNFFVQNDPPTSFVLRSEFLRKFETKEVNKKCPMKTKLAIGENVIKVK